MPDKRPRGYQPLWRPRPATLGLLAAVDVILDRYTKLLPISLRQCFYAAVSDGVLDKTERAYRRLGEAVGMGRRSGRIAWDALRDDSGTCLAPPPAFAGPEDFRTMMRRAAEGYRRDRQEGQEQVLELWSESAGTTAQLARIAEPYGLTVRSGGGFDSLSGKHEAALRAASYGRPLVTLHLGDLDPSGVHVPRALAEDVAAFASVHGGRTELVRVAVTEDQVARYRLPSAPAKPTDRRSFTAHGTTQLEALPPNRLAALVRTAIEDRLDRGVYEAVLVREEAERARLLDELE
ncbi:hypothetical protein AB0G32_14080 [Streptomyces sp. NPDC023723]|uniref:hypothetical protein n=1 Tax=Streptomyces sp. NPDC023723 TaxID=3154323 RepID=UPI0033D6BED2